MTAFTEELIKAAKTGKGKGVSEMVITSIKKHKQSCVGRKRPPRHFVTKNGAKL